MGSTRKYWKAIDELQETPQFLESRDQEFPTQTSVEEFLSDENLKETSTARRDFLKFLGFSVAAATVAACEAPVTKAIPYVNKPENVTPGMATWYASTYYDGSSYASILVKTREGRPIFIKGNKDFGITAGGTNPQIIASVLGLYDSERLAEPTINGKDADIEAIDEKIMGALKSAGKVVLLSNTVISPSTLGAIGELGAFVNGGEEGDKFEHIQYDAISYAGMRAANKASFGLTVSEDPESNGIIPNYDFSKAKTIVSVGADFLNSWLLPTQFTPQYALTRNPDAEWMSRHFQFESIMSVTGSNADYRGMIKPSEEGKVLAYILKKFGADTGGVATDLNARAKKVADQAHKALKASKGEAIVIASSNNEAVQLLANKLNDVVGSYGSTIDLNNPINLYMSDDAKMAKFVKDVENGKGPDAVIIYGANPAYSLPNGAKFAEGLKKIKTTVSLASHADETATNCTYVVPDHHPLEAWSDMQATKMHYALAQPTIRPLHNTHSALESFLVWADKAVREGKDSKVAYEYIKQNWVEYGFPMQSEYADSETYWNMMVHNSCGNATTSDEVELPTEEAPEVTPSTATFNDAVLSGLGSKMPKAGEKEVVFYQKAGIGNGTHANNPWLQELPDPMTKVTWDNYITMNPTEMNGTYATIFDQETGLNQATVKVGSKEITLPVFPLPGQTPGTIGVALGYGRGANGEKIGKAAYQTEQYGGYVEGENGNRASIGQNAFALTSFVNGTVAYSAACTVTKIDGLYPIASTQIHQTVMGRHSIVRETTLDIYNKKDKEAYNPAHMLQKLDEHGNHVPTPVSEFDLWEEHPVEHIGHRWGMSIDLSSCIGCSSCLIACQAENNVPVVGKDEVRRGREMHWIRIDRYFASDEEEVVGLRKDADTFSFSKAELAAENPKVVHMPMMCQHCNHAGCETVCPVAATNHSNEGLNQMAYNRCIGTRYCANNCAYKVRRFNWFNYPSYKAQREINPSQDDLGRMVLNPDVTVRTRGVMEKCSMCVQRIQEGKLVAKKEGRPVVDGDVTTACSDSCPTNAIQIGDWNDIESFVRKSSEDKRAYQALEEVGQKPNVWYKVKVRNEDNKELDAMQVAKESHAAPAGHGEHSEEHGAHEENNHH
ncbi:MAG: TAT-variant-translocated molybdopterin oxidoreductase [Fluviicola sp.]|nr:TAT-variant-translocated molybdopterin oxidoreductase [Fluviicola sp.]